MPPSGRMWNPTLNFIQIGSPKILIVNGSLTPVLLNYYVLQGKSEKCYTYRSVLISVLVIWHLTSPTYHVGHYPFQYIFYFQVWIGIFLDHALCMC
jgi:hypothetical protein